MNRRKIAMQVILAEVAQEGKAGKCAIRAYCETRLSKAKFNEMCRIGKAIYDKNHNSPQPVQ